MQNIHEEEILDQTVQLNNTIHLTQPQLGIFLESYHRLQISLKLSEVICYTFIRITIYSGNNWSINISLSKLCSSIPLNLSCLMILTPRICLPSITYYTCIKASFNYIIATIN